MKQTKLGSIALALLVGAFYSWVAWWFWGAYATSSPITEWLRSTISPQEHRAVYLLGIYAHDLLLNCLLAMPYAAVLLLFARREARVALPLAALSAVAVNLWGSDVEALGSVAPFPGFWLGIGMTALSIPVAFWLLRWAHQRWGGQLPRANTNAVAI